MSDLREQVARALRDQFPLLLRAEAESLTDAAIAVVIEELAQRAENQSRNITTNHKHEEGDYVTFGPLANWLRAQAEGENTR